MSDLSASPPLRSAAAGWKGRRLAKAVGRRPPRIVAVNRHYWPDYSATGQLLADLAEHLAAEGWRVRVVTSRMRYEDPGERLPRRERRRGVAIRRLPTTRFGRRLLLGRAVDSVLFYALTFLLLLATLRRGDVVIAKTDPPLIGTAAWLAARVRGAALVNWCQDIFPDIAAVLGVAAVRGRVGRALKGLGAASLRGASLNVTPHDAMAERIAARGVAPERIAVVPNWPDARVAPVPREANELRRAWGLGDRFVIGYSGNLGRIHDAAGVVRLAVELKDEPGLVLLFIGGGAGMALLRRAAAEHGLENLLLKPYQPREALAESLSLPDLHLVSLEPACEGLAFPSKIAGAMAAGRPILFLGDPDRAVAGLIDATGTGVTLPAGRPETWRAAVATLRGDPERLAGMGRNARTAYEERFTAAASIALWSDLVGRLATPARSAVPAAAAD